MAILTRGRVSICCSVQDAFFSISRALSLSNINNIHSLFRDVKPEYLLLVMQPSLICGPDLILPDVWSLKHEVKEVTTQWAADAPLLSEDCRPLPEPQWGDAAEPLEFPSLVAFELFLQEVHAILGAEMQGHSYNTIGNFLNFYKEFKNLGKPPLWEFYQQYEAKILPESLSCVGLGCSLINSIDSELSILYPELKTALYLASCEEMVIDIESYCNASPPSPELVVKEHVLVVLVVLIEGRSGMIILDPGYHVNIPVVVMSDGMYPHTGWFVLSETPKSKKEYNYKLKGDYIQWVVKETRNGTVKQWDNLVYVRKRFLSHISVSEKRNLVFNFRTIVARDKKQPVAGLYCNLEGDEKFTIFFTDQLNKRTEVKIPFEYFQSNRENNMYEFAIATCARQIGYNTTLITDMITHVIEAYYDQDFMPYVQELNRTIDED